MDVGRRKAGVGISSVVSGSVWESRMKMDEVKGGIKVFNGEDGSGKDGRAVTRAMSKRISTATTDGAAAVSAKRKVWSCDGAEGSEKSPAKGKRNCDEFKSPIQGRKLRSEGNEENSVAIGRIERTPTQIRKSKSEVGSRSNRETHEKTQIQLRKVKSDSIRTIDNDNAKAIIVVAGDGFGANLEHLKNPESESNEVEKGIHGSVKEIEKPQVENESSCREFGVCHIPIKSAQNVSIDDSDVKDENEGDEGEESEEEDIEIEKESFDIKEINLPEPKKVVNEVKRFHQIYQKQSPPINKHSTVYQNLSKPTTNEYHSFQEKSNKLQSLVDLVMWKDVSRSAFVFGIGSFVIISSSYAKDINISFISVVSYLGLFYLAATFLYRSIICRGAIDTEHVRHVVGEEEAIWVLKFVLPYLNEFLLKLRALFCGDPATTMKLAVLLFALARCGSSITVWKVAKWGFFGVFTVPKVCSSYSSQLAAYAKFWVRRFGDAWESCSHKKGVAVAIFVLVWNLSSVVARIWAAFMLFVAFRYYQQSILTDDWVEEDEVEEVGDTCQASIGKEKHGSGPRFGGMTNAKQKKKF
ncbi:reticulon-like protein B21 isoform X2 [Momordica charantia]|uniref:Reticulon-like protein n=1 Tax=Momordica charantia TaxID=3673 RepID=A0A6J1C0X0_MOMCH|nr:reticulon-like protein B21 isoform X2 [Momordica charantia]